MTSTDKSNQILKYLEKNYYVENDKFTLKFRNEHECGMDVVDAISIIFSFDVELCKDALRTWAVSKGIDEETWKKAYRGRLYIRADVNQEMVDDLRNICGIDAVLLLESELGRQMQENIDRDVIMEIFGLGNQNI